MCIRLCILKRHTFFIYRTTHSYCAFWEETNLRYPLPVCKLKENVLEVLGHLWRCKVLERETVVSLSVSANIYIVILCSLPFSFDAWFSSRIFREKAQSLFSYMNVFCSILWKIDSCCIVHTAWYRVLFLEAYLSPFLCWLRLTHALDIVLTVANIQFTRDLLCSNMLKLCFYACNCHLFEDLSLYNLAVETIVLMLIKLAI